MPRPRDKQPRSMSDKEPSGHPEVTVSYRRLSLVVGRGGGRSGCLAAWQRRGADSKPRMRELRVLDDITGSFEPGSMTLVLGQPGSGKSALLRLLAGRVPTAATLVGDVSYNGLARDELAPQLPQLAAYVGQQDVHLPALTVRETLAFACECSGGDGREAVDRALAALGLARCQGTRVGSAEARGVSGGERKRVTIAELASFGAHAVVCYDEASTGLDSAATLDLVHSTRRAARARGATVVMALLQPSPEVLALFDCVLLLHDGQVLFHGPLDRAEIHFAALGCRRPPERDLGDFLCALGADCEGESESDGVALLVAAMDSDAEADAALDSASISQLTGRALAQLWRSSPLGEAMDAQAREASRSRRWRLSNPRRASMLVPPFRQSLVTSTRTLLKREVALLRRRAALAIGRVLFAVAMGAFFGALYADTDLSSPLVALGAQFASLVFLGLSQTARLPALLATRPVFYKQRRANMFRTPAFVLATLGSQAPLVSTEALVLGALVFTMTGLLGATSWRAFAAFELLLVLTALLFGAFFLLLSASFPSLHVAHPVSMLCFLLFLVFSGFVVSKDALSPALAWLYWANPIAWALRALAVNLYRSEQLDVCVHGDIDYCARFRGLSFGEYALQLAGVPADARWLPAGVAFLAALYVLLALLASLALEFRRFDTRREHSVATTTRGAASAGRHQPPKSPWSSFSSGSCGTDAYCRQQTPTLRALQRQEEEEEDDRQPVALLEERRRQRSRSLGPAALAVRGSPPRSPPPTVARVALAFEELRYSVALPRGDADGSAALDLLRGVAGYALPGSMTALMGSSGAGKTTLLDVLAGRAQGNVRGRVLLNGHAASDLARQRCTAYCEQTDVHSGAATIREAIAFSAALRRGQQPARRLTRQQQREEEWREVDVCLELLGLHDIADKIVRDCSMEQMKRLTIGVELAAQPSVLFLDEPTSGLDARSAKLIMDGVRRVADSGRTVVCTIHQPSAEVFFLFDSLLLLQRGGKQVYFGELGHEGRAVIDYFESMPGVPKIRDGYNPATWMLEVIGAGVHSPVNQSSTDTKVVEETDFARAYDSSELKRRLIESRLDLAGVFEPSTDGSTEAARVEFRDKRAASIARQLQLLFWRFVRLYTRTREVWRTQLATSALLALVLGVAHAGTDLTSYSGVNATVGLLFLTVAFTGTVSFAGALALAAGERAAFYRERAVQTYGAGCYLVASSLAKAIFAAVAAFVFTVVFFPLTGMLEGGGDVGAWAAMGVFWAATTLHMIFQAGLAQLFMFVLPSTPAAALTGTLVDCVCFLLAGYSPPASHLSATADWLRSFVPHAYVFSTLASAVFGRCSRSQLARAAADTHARVPASCRMLEDAPATIGRVFISEYVAVIFRADRDNLARDAGRFLLLLATARLLAGLAMRFIHHGRK